MRDRSAELEAHGLDVVVVLCQKREAVSRWIERRPLPFPVLIDDDRSRAKRWGVYVALSYDAIHIARPASFVVDPGGIVRYARVARHQMDHAEIGEVLRVTPSPSRTSS